MGGSTSVLRYGGSVDRHLDHDDVAEEVRSWYTSSTPELGLTAIRESFGFLTQSDHAAFRRLVLAVADPADVAPAISAAREFYGGGEFAVWVDDRRRAERLSGALAG